MLNSENFVDKFKKMTNDSAFKKGNLKNAKEMLNHRSGQNGEDLYLYNTKTKRWMKSTTGKEAGTPKYNDEIKEAILEIKQRRIDFFS